MALLQGVMGMADAGGKANHSAESGQALGQQRQQHKQAQQPLATPPVGLTPHQSGPKQFCQLGIDQHQRLMGMVRRRFSSPG